MTKLKFCGIIYVENKLERGYRNMASKYKVLKTIVNGDKALIGLVIQGKKKDIIGGFSDETIEVPKSFADLIAFNGGAGFRNSQITVTKNGFNELGGFKLNSLPMLCFDKTTDSYLSIPNGVKLVARIVQGKETAGFRVEFETGEVVDYTYKNVVTLANWFKPKNFSVRTRSNDGGPDKNYISGYGITLSDLPAINAVGGTADTSKTRGKSTVHDKRKDNILSGDFDILDVYDIICKYNGQVIKLPGEKYVPATYDKKAEQGKFVPFGIGEVASPKLQFNATKLNVNAGFKKVGYVPVKINGINSTITTFTYATKSIFVAGENYIKVFGIAVPSANEHDLVAALGKSLALEKITDASIIQPLSSVIDADSLVFYKVTSKNLELISESKIKASVLSAEQIVSLVKEITSYKLVAKAMGAHGLLGKYKTTYDGMLTEDGKIANNMALYSEEIRSQLQGLGFNIHTGAYTERFEKTEKKASSGASGSTPVEITYSVDGCDISKITGLSVLEHYDSQKIYDLPIYPAQYQEIKKVMTLKDKHSMLEAAKALENECNKQVAILTKKLWMHNASQFLLGRKTNIHTSDAKDWTFVKSLKTGDVYKNTRVPALSVKVSGVTIPTV